MHFLTGCSQSSAPTVVVYASQDQVYAEPILRAFTEQTKIVARTVYDSEAVKTVGLANRLLAERGHPQCDVFWNNEELRTRQLEAENVFREANAWRAMGFRSRRLVINTNLLPVASAPRGLTELTNAHWRGKVAVAYPLFGTTAAHFLALRQHWGVARWENWCRDFHANRPRMLDGNSVVVQWVGRGEASIGLTDSDDIAAGQREGLPIMALPLAEESLLIPNTIAVVRDAPHAHAAQQLFAFLQQTNVIERLIRAQALEGTSMNEVQSATLRPNWDRLLAELETGARQLQAIFLR